MIHRKVHPKNIYLADHESVVDGTISTLALLKQHATAFLVPSRTQDDVTVHYSGEDVDYQEQGSSGMLVLSDRVSMSKGTGFTVNMGRWSFEIAAMREGQNQAAVETDHQAGIDGPADSTAVKGIAPKATVLKKKFAALIEMPANPDDGKVLYILLPKVVAALNDYEQQLNHSQQNPALRFDATLLETAEVTNYQALYNKVTDDGLCYWFEGKADAP